MSTCAAHTATHRPSYICDLVCRGQAGLAAASPSARPHLEFFPAFSGLSHQHRRPIPCCGRRIFAIAVVWFMTGLTTWASKGRRTSTRLHRTQGHSHPHLVALCFASASGSSALLTMLPHAVGGFSGSCWPCRHFVGLRRLADLVILAGESTAERTCPSHDRRPVHHRLLYMATNAAMQYVLSATQIAASNQPAVAALRLSQDRPEPFCCGGHGSLNLRHSHGR